MTIEVVRFFNKRLMTGASELLFSDLIRGPANSPVWLYGWELPSNPVVRLNGGSPLTVLVNSAQWVPANGNNPELRRCCVTVPSAGTITIDGLSGSVDFTLTGGTIYEISPPNCNTTLYSDGDLLLLRAGTYTGTFGGYGSIVTGVDGLSVAGYPGEEAIVDCSSSVGSDAQASDMVNFAVSNLFYYGGASGYGNQGLKYNRAGSRTGFRVVGCKFSKLESESSGCVVEFTHTMNMMFLANIMYDNGNPATEKGHEVYFGGKGTNNYEIDISYNYSLRFANRFNIDIYGHTNSPGGDESLTGLRIQHNYIDRENLSNGTANGIAVGGSDANGSPIQCDPNNAWIQDCLIHSNTVLNVPGSCSLNAYTTGGCEIRCSDVGCDYIVTDNVTNDATSPFGCLDCVGSMTQSGNSWN